MNSLNPKAPFTKQARPNKHPTTIPMKIDVIHRDATLAVINKPSGIAMFSDRTGSTSLWEMLKSHFTEEPIYQVHRIDKGTSGVLLVALSKHAQAQLNRQFLHRTVEKYYLAICIGKPKSVYGRIDLPLCPGSKNRFRVAGKRDTIIQDTTQNIPTWSLSSQDPQYSTTRKVYPSQTLFHTVFSNDEYSLLLLKPITGRTHQIRVHLSWIGHPLLGDTLYGKPKSKAQNAERLALHSHTLQYLQNWIAGQEAKQMNVQAPIPDFFKSFVNTKILHKPINTSNFHRKIDTILEKEMIREARFLV